MKKHARVVVIGGGIGGLSTLYHLTREGWHDVVLLERDELTSGTTWHSAAQCPNLAFNQLLIALRGYTISHYKELAEHPEYPINYLYAVGGLRLITNPIELDACRHVITVGQSVGAHFEIVGKTEAAQLNPLLDTDDLLAALYDPLDGDIDPAQLCQALARRARKAGAEINRFTPVTGLTQKLSHEWVVHTPSGDITCEHVVNAAGYRVNEVGAMMGVAYPVVSMEHMYFVTEAIEQLSTQGTRVAMVRCPRDTFYLRQERDGLLVGVYEQDCKTFGLDGIDPNFTNALCPNDLDRCLPKLEKIFQRVPCLQEVGIKSMVTGPITYSADAGPLVGKLPGRRNAWSMNGLRVGIGEGGGYGKMLAQLMVHGEAEWDCWQLDPRRITAYADQAYTAAKAIEDYQNEFRWHRPHEHRPAGRPAKTSPLYPLLKEKGAVFGQVNGWERVLFFKPESDFQETHSYRFDSWHPLAAEEVAGLCQGVGLAEISGFNRYEIGGPGTRDWLDRLTCSRLPQQPGKVSLAYFLTPRGNILSEATIAVLATGRLWYGSAATAEYHDMDWLREALPNDGSVQIKSLTNEMTTLVLAGPRTRDLLRAVCPDEDWSAQVYPPLTVRSCRIGPAEAVIMSVSYSGEDAAELHLKNRDLVTVFRLLLKQGTPLGLTLFGGHAIESMRLEKGYGHWKADLITEYNPIEAGLDRFVRLEKDFIGRTDLIAQMKEGPRRRRVLLTINSDQAPAQPGEAVFAGEKVIGSITSAAWGYRTQKNIAMAYLDPAFAQEDKTVEVQLPGDRVSAKVHLRALI